MRASRLLSILITLQVRGRVTARTLAEQFEVSERTIYRDIDELSAAGVPVYADRGPGGGFQLLDGYRTRLTGLNPDEADAFALMGLPGPAADLGLAEPAAAAKLKLMAALPGAAGAGALRVADRFHLDPLDWYRRTARPPHLAAVSDAVWRGRRLRVRYESWSSDVRRTLDPLGVVLKAGAWYLVARSGARTLTYRIANILEAAVLDEPFDPPEGFNLADHWRASVDRFEASLRRGQATLKVAESALANLTRLGGDIAEAVLAAQPDADGFRCAAVPIEGIGQAARLLLGFGDEVEVIEPAALREELARRARGVVAMYG